MPQILQTTWSQEMKDPLLWNEMQQYHFEMIYENVNTLNPLKLRIHIQTLLDDFHAFSSSRDRELINLKMVESLLCLFLKPCLLIKY